MYFCRRSSELSVDLESLHLKVHRGLRRVQNGAGAHSGGATPGGAV